MDARPTIRVAELFAGVGGFRLALDGYRSAEHPEFEKPAAGPFRTVWANQWEPPGTDSKQFAWRCYESRFGEGSCVNEDIAVVLDKHEAGELDIPDVDMVVGGFPCQDYSVAKPLSQAGGIEGEKGVLWWSIYRFLRLKGPKYCLFENVDRLLKSPARQRGRDFAIILSCLSSLGYSVEWRVVNSAEYGFPQRRKRVFVYAERDAGEWDLLGRVLGGVMARALPIAAPDSLREVDVSADPYDITTSFNPDGGRSPFESAGVMQRGVALTGAARERYDGPRLTLGDVVVPDREVPEEFFVPGSELGKWEYLKGAKRERRRSKTGHEYWYSEGSMAFPDLLENPSRTILTGEGGRGASRFKHIIQCGDGRYRRLTPDELDMLQGFPRGWTDTGMTDGRRAFCMGNALVVGVPHLIGRIIAEQ
ncbi:MAG: DNA (cytosine-5-)-methyltransferase [Atopobiaceae bacterium]|nr:DNA (cytosine-5-)-methyltransferase [Atopobiaceae bacterium]